jgi:peptide/nickel transport system substrate-binding protein
MLVAMLIAANCPTRAEEAPHHGGVLTFSNSLGEPETFDCHATASTSVMYRVAPHYSLLIKIDPKSGEVVPDLAQSWTVSPDLRTYTFKIRSGVHFHDGSELTARDIKASIDRVRQPPPGVVSFRRSIYTDIADTEAPDKQTFVVKLSQTNVAMLKILANPFNCIYSAAKLAQDPKFPERHVLGTGPFKFVSYVPGGEWVGTRFDDYFRKGLPYLDGFKVLNVSPQSLGTVLSSGQVQADFAGVSPPERARIEPGGHLVFNPVPVTAMIFMIVNTSKPPLNDVRVRQALNLAIDRHLGHEVLARQMTLSVVGSWSRPNTFFAPSKAELASYPGYRPDIEASRSEARRLLAEAGVKDLKLTFLNRPSYTPLGVFLIDQWRQVGITVTQETPDNQRYFALQRSGEYDLSVNAATGLVDDPTIQMSQEYSYDKNPQNLTRFNDDKFDKMFDEQAQTTDPDARKRIVLAMDRRLMDTASAIPLFWQTRTVALSPQVHGYVPGPSMFVNQDLAEVWLSGPQQ